MAGASRLVGGQVVVQPRDGLPRLVDRQAQRGVSADFGHEELLIAGANSARQRDLVVIVHQSFRFREPAFDLFARGGNGFQMGPIARCQELGQFHARLADRKDQLFGRLNGRHVQRDGLGGAPLQTLDDTIRPRCPRSTAGG